MIESGTLFDHGKVFYMGKADEPNVILFTQAVDWTGINNVISLATDEEHLTAKMAQFSARSLPIFMP